MFDTNQEPHKRLSDVEKTLADEATRLRTLAGAANILGLHQLSNELHVVAHRLTKVGEEIGAATAAWKEGDDGDYPLLTTGDIDLMKALAGKGGVS